MLFTSPRSRIANRLVFCYILECGINCNTLLLHPNALCSDAECKCTKRFACNLMCICWLEHRWLCKGLSKCHHKVWGGRNDQANSFGSKNPWLLSARVRNVSTDPTQATECRRKQVLCCWANHICKQASAPWVSVAFPEATGRPSHSNNLWKHDLPGTHAYSQKCFFCFKRPWRWWDDDLVPNPKTRKQEHLCLIDVKLPEHARGCHLPSRTCIFHLQSKGKQYANMAFKILHHLESFVTTKQF